MSRHPLLQNALTPEREWFEKSFPGYPHFIVGICEGIVQTMHRRFGDGFHCAVGFCMDKRFNWFWQVKDMVRLRKKFIDRTIRDFRYPDRLIRRWKKDWNIFLATADEVNRTDLKTLSDSELVCLYRKLFKDFNWQISLAQLTDALLTAGSEDWFERFLRDRLPDVSDDKLQTLFAALSAPVYPSFSSTEHIDLLRIASMIRRRPALARAIRTGKRTAITATLKRAPAIRTALEKHRDQFHWTQNNYFHVFHPTVYDVIRSIRKLLRENSRIEKRYSDEKSQAINSRRDKQRLIKCYHLSRDIRAVIHLIEEFTLWHDTRKSGIMRNNHCLYAFLKEISRRTHLPLSELYYTYEGEVDDIVLRRTCNRRVLRQRQRSCVFVYTATRHRLFQGTALNGFDIRFFQGVHAVTKKIQGVAASPGKVRGMVCLVITQKDFAKMKKGNILVTNNTTPEFVPLMKKAAGIVTEQGGMTTHAAIVSRELGVPCVIGTKVATKVLKDGDRVEVDATKGIVRKL